MENKGLKEYKGNTIFTKDGFIKGGFEDTRDRFFLKPPTEKIEILPFPMWNLTKCYDGAIQNALQINYGDKNIIILITDDLYLALKKLTETPKEETSNE